MIAIKDEKMPEGCQHCMYFRKHIFGRGLDYSYSCARGATQFPMPWIRQMEERASDCPLVEIVTCKNCDYWRFNENASFICGYCNHLETETGEDFYCGDAERRGLNGIRIC